MKIRIVRARTLKFTRDNNAGESVLPERRLDREERLHRRRRS